MKQQYIIILALLLPVLMFAAAPVVSNVQVSQRDDGSMLVDISYDVADADGDDLEISLACSNDGGVTWDYAITAVTGDVGPGIAPGTGKTIVWDGASEHPDDYDTDFMIRVTAEDGNYAGPAMILVPAGSFQMGRAGVAEPIHTVNLDAFYIGTYEVTQQEWVNVMGSNPSYFTGDLQRPVEMVSWYDVVKYCNYRSILQGLTPVYTVSGDTNPDTWGASFDPDVNWSADGYRLPTEAEWDYSARGATNTPDYLYAGSDNIDDVAWYSSNSGSQTHPVGQKAANGIGTYDQSGNVWEYCWDWYGSYSSDEQTNPSGPESGIYRVTRGGGWYYDSIQTLVARHDGSGPSGAYTGGGFRLARTANPTPPGFVYVPAGSFQMGRTGVATPIHTVNLDAFYVGTYEVTQQEWVDVMGSNPSNFNGDLQRPVEQVSWYSVVKYCNYRSIQEGLTPVYSVSGDTNPDNWGGSFTPDVNWSANGYRLPTEAEWEYSARGATNTPDYLYAGSDNIDDVAWYWDNSGSTTHPVGQKAANGIGTYDQSGNVWEWCWDWSGSYSSNEQTNPYGPETGSYRMVRGGGWSYESTGCRVDYRVTDYLPYNSGNYLGFRLARTPTN